ncbi:hypothetical protein BC936DRAFT_142064, partial [Jimgerdemannia flammicorona]
MPRWLTKAKKMYKELKTDVAVRGRVRTSKFGIHICTRSKLIPAQLDSVSAGGRILFDIFEQG